MFGFVIQLVVSFNGEMEKYANEGKRSFGFTSTGMDDFSRSLLIPKIQLLSVRLMALLDERFRKE